MVTLSCEGCGRPFEARRSDARACSARCRKRAQRQREASERDRKRSRAGYMRERRARERAELAPARPPAPAPATTLLEYARGLTVTQGEHAGELLPWQREYLERAELAAGGELGLSVAAGAGKTTLVATIAAAGVAGPLARPRADVLVVAGSFAQACLEFDHAHAFLRPIIAADPERWRVLRSDQRAMIEDRATGAKLAAREANARTLHGTAPALIVADEPAQWQPTQRDAIYAALRSRLGKIPGARLVAIGTRPDDPSHWFARLLVRNGIVYAADPTADPFDAAGWPAANPSLSHFPELLRVYHREAAEAAADPSLLPAFRALRLNLGTADHEISVLIEAERWEACEADLLPEAAGPAVWGVDLSGGDAMAAISSYWPRCGRLEAMAAFPELPELAKRARTDGADYQRMAAEGDLLVIGRRVVPVAELVREALERWQRPVRIIADYHHERELRQALEAADFPAAALVTASMGGLKDSLGRVRDFRRAVNGGRVWCRPRLLVRSSMANARTVADSMGEERLIKGGVTGRRRTARDDVAVAIAAAVSEGWRLPRPRRARVRHAIAG